MFKNTMKTSVLLAAMGGLIVAVAGLIGGGSSTSFTIGVAIALVMVGGSYWFSDKLALASAKATVIEREQTRRVLRHRRFAGTEGRHADAAGGRVPQRSAQRLRHRPRAEEGRRVRHHRPAEERCRAMSSRV